MNSNGRMPAREFYDNELSQQERAKILTLFNRFATMGFINNKEQFKPLCDRLFEFKHFQLRFIGGYGPGQGDFSVAVGLKKKKEKHSQRDLERAKRILSEHFDVCR